MLSWTKKSGECEANIDSLRMRIRNQGDTINTRRMEARRLEEEARKMRSEADSACMRYEKMNNVREGFKRKK